MKLKMLQDLSAFLTHLSKREKVILYGAVIFISLAFFDRLIINMVSGKIKSLNQEIEARESGIRRDLKILTQKQRIDIQRANYSSYLEGVKSENEETTGLLKDIESLANKAAIYLIDMKPAGIKEAGQTKKYLVNLNCEGKMEQLAEFMYNVETYKKLLSIEKYQINPKSKDTDIAKCSMSISKLVIP
jgi:Tfp pilus assembly protein PilO